MPPFWTCARLQPGRENLAATCLGMAGYAFYFPRVQPPRKRGSRHAPAPQLLFPCYGFIRIELQWSKANGCFGVHRLLTNGGAGPVHVPDIVIDAIRAKERNGFVTMPRTGPQPGDAVRVIHGVLQGQVGTLLALRPNERVAVLLAALGRTTLAAADIELTD